MKAKANNKLRGFSPVVGLDDSLIRTLIALEIISRSGIDLQKTMKNIFSKTWIYQIITAFIIHGEMNKAELCLILFPDQKDRHYKLSRSNQVLDAFNYLLNEEIIVLVEDLGHKKVYDISSKYRCVLRALICGDVIALIQTWNVHFC